MKSERAQRENLAQIELDIKDAEQFYLQTKDMADRQISEAQQEYDRQKSAAKEQLADARRKLAIARARRRNFLRYHQ